ncbi:MAG TPA: glycosyltransferase family 2 protein [Gammaproteobacteria bacterium]|nr:glycosyltransferase family 2 protein [Gammaproteobacteria bacterium]
MRCVDIVIVNWNSANQIGECLSSIGRFNTGNISKVVVVDNGSSDGSADNFSDFSYCDSLQIEVVRNADNRGFARACNQGAVLCNADYILFLNPDTKLFEKSLVVPVAFMEDPTNKNVGICGIQLVDKKGRVARTCANFPTLARFIAQAMGLNKIPGLKGTGGHMDDWDHCSEKRVDHVIGAFFLVRKNLFEALSGFDERFFVYLEDIDFSFRAGQQGWKTLYLSDAQAFHEGGGLSKQVMAKRLFYSLRSRLLYGFKHFSWWQAWLLVGVVLLIEPFVRTVFLLFRGDFTGVWDTWSAYNMLYRDFPNFLSISFARKAS